MVKALLLIYAVWGFNWVVMKLAGDFFSPIMFSTYRFSTGAMVLLAVVFLRRLPLPPPALWKWIALTGILQISISNVIVQICIESLGAGLSAVLNYTMPVWVALLAHFFLRERLTVRKILGIALAVFGLVILMNVSLSGNADVMLLALAGAFVWGMANVVYKAKLTKCDMTVFNAWQMAIGAAVLVLVAVMTGQDAGIWTLRSFGYVAYNGVLASALAFFLWSYVLSHIEAGKASVAVLAVPAVGVLCGVLFLGEALTASMLLGILLILAGIVIVVWK